MVEVFQILIDRFEEFQDNFNRHVERAVQDVEYIVLDMNTEDQLYEKGINRVGVDISDYAPYSPVTIEIKQQKGQPTNRVTLRDEGDFEHSFYVEYKENGFEIKASDWKTEELIKKYGKQIMGLTDDNANELLTEYIMPYLIDRLNGIK